MRSAVLCVVIAAIASPGAAQSVNGDAARQQIYPTRGVQVAVSRSLSAEERAIVQELVKEADRTGQGFRYYGSIAYSPSEGMTGQSIRGAFNYHSTDAADSAAVASCNAAGGRGGCQVAAHILPRGYEPGRMQLSYDATNAFRSTYRRVRGAKALAISPGTGAWKMAEGNDTADATTTAVELCNQDAARMGGRTDCTAVVVD